MSYRDEVMALRGQGQWMHCCDVDDAAKVAAKSDIEIAGIRSSLAGAYAKLAMAESKAARLTDENKKYAKALTEHQGSIDWREWMLVPATEANFVSKEKHDQIAARADARIAELEQSVTVRDTEIARLETDLELARRDERERNSLRDFVNDVMESWPHGDVDGCDLERMAVEHGLLALKDPKPTEPCGDNCACSGYPSPEEWAGGVDCYVRTPLLTGSIDAARAGKP